MRRATAAILLVCISCTSQSSDPAPTERRGPPNVLIVVTDDQRLDGTIAVLPEVRRRIGAAGVTFTRSFATTPLCCPSRASIFTGRYAHNHGVLKNTEPEVLDQRLTLQRYLSEAGYRTGFFGKYFNAWEVENAPPHFDEWAIWTSGYRNWRVGTPQGVKEPDGYSTSYLGRKGVRFLHAAEGDDKSPWLLFVSTSAAHKPFAAERSYRDSDLPAWNGNPATREQDVGDKPVIPGRAISRADGARLRERQLRALLSVDDLVSRLDEELDALGEAEETLVVFTSDNGYSWGEHGILGKRTPYRESVMVPLLLRWPGRIEPGTTDDRLVANIDIAPTVMEAAGLEPTEPMDGRSLLGGEARGVLLLEQWGNYSKGLMDWAGLVTGRGLYVEHYGREGKIRFRELYDLEADPWQTDNLAAEDDGPSLRRLYRRLAEARECRPGRCP